MASVFLSYDRDDTAKARSIAAALEKAGHSVWWDTSISGGSQFAKEIEQALDKADVVVVLWTSFSIESAWVKDEAGAGRDKGCLVPLSLEGTLPPLGFRQFQAIDLGRWRGRGRIPHLKAILEAIEHRLQACGSPVSSDAHPAKPRRAGPSLNMWAVIGVAIAMFFVVVGLLIGRPWEAQSSNTPTVSVTAADRSALSQDMARNLLVKLGGQQTDPTKSVRVIDSSKGVADIQFRMNGSQRGGLLHANVSLTSGRDQNIVWSKDFERAAAEQSDLEDSMASAAGRVLRCARDEASGEYGRLNEDLRRTYLNACAALTEAYGDGESLIPQLREVTQKAPRFRPAWAQLLTADSDYLSSLHSGTEDAATARVALSKDAAAARRIDPDMAEATLAELGAHSDLPPAQAMAIVDKAKAEEPTNPHVLVERSTQLARVGRMEEARAESEAAVKLDPLSPSTRVDFIMATIFAGKVDRARLELASAKRLWPDSPAVREAEYELALRYDYGEDFEKMSRDMGYIGPGFEIYSAARRHPSDATIAPYMAFMRNPENKGRMGFALQGLGEVDRPNEFYQLLAEVGDGGILSHDASILFRPWMATIRRDPRFMVLARRLGLVDYWRTSGQWPDFCAEAGLRYDCKTEAATLS